jgi:hypothetical protein
MMEASNLPCDGGGDEFMQRARNGGAGPAA